MRVISRRRLRLFCEDHPQGLGAMAPLQDWYAQATAADWSNPSALKAQFGNASILKNGRVVLNIGATATDSWPK